MSHVKMVARNALKTGFPGSIMDSMCRLVNNSLC
jgi:hypothetical protein